MEAELLEGRVDIVVPTADAMRRLGRRVAALLRAGDLVVLSGPLGSGKTTFVQGLGAGLGVRGEITSPTFVIARVHPSVSGGPALVHADAYRLGGRLEVDDLDLDASIPDSVTVVEWGEEKVEMLTEDRLRVVIERDVPADGTRVDERDEPRRVHIFGEGSRWAGEDFSRLL